MIGVRPGEPELQSDVPGLVYPGKDILPTGRRFAPSVWEFFTQCPAAGQLHEMVGHQPNPAKDFSRASRGTPGGGVFLPLHIERPEAVILDTPMPAHHKQYLFWSESAGGNATQEVALFAVDFAIKIFGDLLDPPDLAKAVPIVLVRHFMGSK